MGDGTGIGVTDAVGDGARLTPKYHSATHDVVGVPVMEIRDSISSAVEEVAQFSFGGFFMSGSFWLGIERFVTEGPGDNLVIICVISFFFGAGLAITGYRQARRRVTRLARYIPNDNTS